MCNELGNQWDCPRENGTVLLETSGRHENLAHFVGERELVGQRVAQGAQRVQDEIVERAAREHLVHAALEVRARRLRARPDRHRAALEVVRRRLRLVDVRAGRLHSQSHSALVTIKNTYWCCA